MVSVLNKEPKYKVEQLKYRKLEVVYPRIKNKPSWISPHEVLQSRLINTVYHLLVKDNKGKGRGAYWLSSPEKGALIGEKALIWEGVA